MPDLPTPQRKGVWVAESDVDIIVGCVKGHPVLPPSPRLSSGPSRLRRGARPGRGPQPDDRWAYYLADSSGQKSDAVKLESPRPGSPCAAFAYPVGNVVVAGGSGDWFNGKVERACRHAYKDGFIEGFPLVARLPIAIAGGGVPRVAVVTTTAILKAVNVQLFELGMWQAWSGKR